MSNPEPELSKDSPNRMGEKGENNLEKALGNGNLIPGSGSGNRKGDFGYQSKDNNPYKHKHMIEKKSTDKKSIKIQQEWLKKLKKDALNELRLFALVVEWEVTDNWVDDQWAMIPLDRFKELTEKEEIFDRLLKEGKIGK